MKKIKNMVLSILLFTFTFILVHDYVIVDTQSSSSYTLVHVECEESAIELTSYIHDSIHSLLIDSTQKLISIAILTPYIKQTQQRDLFIPHVNSVPVRPPLS